MRAAITLKIRGGAHSANNPDLASCTMMTFQAASTGAVARFGKELIHPIYNYVKLTPAFNAALIEYQWFGLKLLSYGIPGDSTRVVNRLYLEANHSHDRAADHAIDGSYSPNMSTAKA